MASYARYIGKNGYEFERNKADKVFDKEKQYKIVGGYLGDSSSAYEFEGIEGSWNTVMFDADDGAWGKLTPTYRGYPFDE